MADLKKNNSLPSEVLHLDLKKKNSLFSKVIRHVACSKNLIFIAGAGISCSGGYSSNVLFEMIKQKCSCNFRSVKELFNTNLHISDEAVKAFYNFMKLYTQNIDYLKEKAELKVWNFEKFKCCQAQVVQLHGTLANLQCKLCTNVCSFTQEYCDIFTEGEISNCTECEEKVILYGNGHPNKLEIREIAAYDQKKADCLIIMGTSLRILGVGVKNLIKEFAKAVHESKGYVIMVNATNVVTKEWNGIIDYQIVSTCDDWVELVDKELSNVKATKLNHK
ncbi:21209_t:CDS:2 [Gigaspora margarita]|uniref:21209_t:CDS:1 n=1 Tax=Gigaspora margarita TaxID=4874 RepID=A0ABN7V4L1_GIGMA|nr:21209_t:CDS:2 [Gigaspora margarita]